MTSQVLFRHDMQITSLDAFYSLQPCELPVLEAFAKIDEKTGKRRALSGHQVEVELGWAICSVSGRLTNLKRMGFLEIDSVGIRPNGRSENLLKITKAGLHWLEERRDGK